MEAERWKKLKKTFTEALELDKAERDAYLQEVCDKDGELLEEVRSLLEAYTTAGPLDQPLEELRASALSRLASKEQEETDEGQRTGPDPLVGQTISRYKIKEKLGRGGMGVVYKARDTRLGRTVALKFLPSHLSASEKAKQRFAQEARAASALDHPNIAIVHDIGETESGQPFIAMAYYDGKTLKEKIAGRPLPIEEALDITVQIARGLHKAHTAGILHRDIKPANVMVTDNGEVKILDFGLAKLEGAPGLTKTGAAMGTATYMSPEQIRGETVDHRTDIWSLGVVLYEMLSGKCPFPGEHKQAILYNVCNEEPKPVQEQRADIPDPLAAVVTTCLAKNLALRYPSAEELLADLKSGSALSPDERLPVRPSGDWRSRLSSAWRRWPVPLAGLVLGVLLLTVVLGNNWMRSSAPEGSIAVLPFVSVNPEGEGEFFSDGVTEEIITHLSAVPDLKVISRTSAMRYKGSDRPLRQIADELDVAHILEGSIRRADGRVRISTQLIDAGTGYHRWSSSYNGELVDIFGLQQRIAREVVGALEERLGARGEVSPAKRGTRDPEALELFLRGRYHWKLRTHEGHERAQAYFERAIERDSTYADAYAGLAVTYGTRHQLGRSSIPRAETYSRIKWAAERAVALDESSADAHVALAMTLWWQQNWPGAERELLRALELNPGHATARAWYALLLSGWGRMDEALREIRRAYDVDPFSVIVSANYAAFLYLDRRYDRAIKQGRKTLDLAVPWWRSRARLGLSYVQAGRSRQAIRVLRQAVEEFPDEPDLLADFAYVLASAGDREEAVTVLRRAKQRGSAPFPVGRAYVGLQKPDSALAWLRQSPWPWPHRANRFDPALDPLRDDPRFKELSARIERDLGIH